jgi:hypothetical protein
MNRLGRLNGYPVMTGYPAVQFFEKATVGGRVKGDIQRHWLDIQMGVNQAVGYSHGQKKDRIKTFILKLSKGLRLMTGLQPGETTSSNFFGLQVHFSSLAKLQ